MGITKRIFTEEQDKKEQEIEKIIKVEPIIFSKYMEKIIEEDLEIKRKRGIYYDGLD